MELSKWINRVVARRSPDNAWVALSDLPNLLARFRFVAECQLSGFPQLEPDCPKTAQHLTLFNVPRASERKPRTSGLWAQTPESCTE